MWDCVENTAPFSEIQYKLLCWCSSMNPSNTLECRWGILSTAEIATKVHLAMEIAENAKVVAVASRTIEKAREWASERGIEIAYGSYLELLQDESIDAVYIPLPTAFKKEWTIKAAQHGKHVLVEKPLPENMEDLQEMVDACLKHNVQFMDGTMWLHSVRTDEIQKILPSIGTIHRINAAFTFPAPSIEWIEGGNGRTDPKREPQGCLECGWYPIGAILFSKGFQLPSKVQVLHSSYNKVGGLVACAAVMWFADGSYATFDCGYEAAHRCFCEVSGSKGTLMIEDVTGGQGKSGNFDAYFVNFVGSSYYKLDDSYGKETVVQVEPCNHTKLMIEHFGDLVLHGTDRKWPDVSLKMQRTLNAVFLSATEGHRMVNLEE